MTLVNMFLKCDDDENQEADEGLPMQDKNETAALVRRLGGAAAVARLLDISRQAVHRWVENDQISETYVPDMLDLCVIDQLPVLQSQIRERWEMVQGNFATEK